MRACAMKGLSRASPFFRAEDGLAQVVNRAILIDASQRQDVVACRKFVGRHDERKARAGFRDPGFNGLTAQDLCATYGLQ